jgi:hypothetical protein
MFNPLRFNDNPSSITSLTSRFNNQSGNEFVPTPTTNLTERFSTLPNERHVSSMGNLNPQSIYLFDHIRYEKFQPTQPKEYPYNKKYKFKEGVYGFCVIFKPYTLNFTVLSDNPIEIKIHHMYAQLLDKIPFFKKWNVPHIKNKILQYLSIPPSGHIHIKKSSQVFQYLKDIQVAVPLPVNQKLTLKGMI